MRVSEAKIQFSVPQNIESFWSKLYGPRWIWVNAEEHLFHFPSCTVNRILRRAGLDFIWAKTFAGHKASIFPNRYNSKDGRHFFEMGDTTSIISKEYQAKGNLGKALFYIKHREFIPLIKKIAYKIEREGGMHLLSPIINSMLAKFNIGDELVVLAKKKTY